MLPLFLAAVLMLGWATAMHEADPQFVTIPEAELYPVIDRNPAYTGQPGRGGMSKAAIAPNRVIRVPTWPRGQASDSVSHAAGTSETVNVPPTAIGEQRINEADSQALGSHLQDATPEILQTDVGLPVMPSDEKQILAFRETSSGRLWGPFRIGANTFSRQAYPLDLPAFKHLYHSEDVVPTNFEEFLSGNHYRSVGTTFRPEPSVLRAIYRTVWNQLGRERIRFRRVPSTFRLHQGDFLWPPATQHPLGLDIPESMFTDRIRPLLGTRITSHSASSPKLYHMEVVVNGEVRHIMMTHIKPGYYVEPRTSTKGSELWMFFEGMKPSSLYGRPMRTALLGATFLPEKARDVLLRAGTIRVAFPSLAAARP